MDSGSTLSLLLAKLLLAFPLAVIAILKWFTRSINGMSPETLMPSERQIPFDANGSAEIFRKAVLLRRLNLPADLIPTILDFAGCGYRVIAGETHQVRHVSRHESGQIYLAAQIPSTIAPTSLRRVIFTTTSHDQGYSWDYSSHGSYNGSWTWFGVTTVDHETLKDPKFRDDGKRIITNLHADYHFRIHSVALQYDDPDPEIQQIFQALKTGGLVALTMCAAFPAWVNHAQSAKIEFDVQPVRKI